MTTINMMAGAQERAGDAVSRSELERLEAQRRVPMLVRTLTPHGAGIVNSGLDQQREQRIAEMAARLDAVAGRASDAFALGKVRGTAKTGFERER